MPKLQESKLVTKTNRASKKVSSRISKQKRSRKTYDQMIVLFKYFKEDPSWGRSTVQKVKKELGMKTSQIYKWGYDQKIKAENETKGLPNSPYGHGGSSFCSDYESDQFMSDRSVTDYNLAVVAICESVSSNFGTERKIGKNSHCTSDQDHQKLLNVSIEPDVDTIENTSEKEPSRLFTLSDTTDPIEELNDQIMDDFYYQFLRNGDTEEISFTNEYNAQQDINDDVIFHNEIM